MTLLDPVVNQPALFGACPLAAAVNELSSESGVDERGAIFTRPEVAEFMLDLAGYVESRDLQKCSLLEPSFGGGEFLLAAIRRLLASRERSVAAGHVPGPLDDCIRAVELHEASFRSTKERVFGLLVSSGIDSAQAGRLADTWLMHGDFLLSPFECGFDVVVGNPPYVRQELIPPVLLAEYRSRYQTLYDRADLYIPFFERSLKLLKLGGKLSFICADRWMKNKYGGPLRALVAQDFHLQAYVDMVDTPAFQSEVTAYPAITVFERAKPGSTFVAVRPDIDPGHLRDLAAALQGKSSPASSAVHELDRVVVGGEPWVLQLADATAVIRRIEEQFPSLEDAGCKVGIGVATGADKVFVGDLAALDVEDSRKIPLVMRGDITSGHVVWRGLGAINPFTDDGPLVKLADFPRLRAYLEKNREAIMRRHVAKRDEARWYRTIDRITPSLASRPKLLIPDINGAAQVVYEEGRLYPHHNLYYVVSEEWDLHALQAVLLSSVARHFVATYSTKMRGGHLRYQAQYLRRIRIPRWSTVEPSMRLRLQRAARALDVGECDEAVCALYGLTAKEQEVLRRS